MKPRKSFERSPADGPATGVAPEFLRKPSEALREAGRIPLRGFIAAMLLLVIPATHAQWRTQEFDLVQGWNAVYLHVDATYARIENFVDGTPIKEVWLWNPSSSSLQFIDSVHEPVTGSSNWKSWDADDLEPGLITLLGNAAYLVNLTENYTDSSGAAQVLADGEVFTWTVKGEPVPPVYDWNSDGQNLIGFSIVPSKADLLFDNFLGLNDGLNAALDTIYHYIGGEIEPSLIESDTLAVEVVRGQAYWLDAEGFYNDYFGPFQVRLEDLSGVHFGDRLSQYRLRLSNTSNADVTVTLSMEPTEAVPTVDDLPFETTLPEEVVTIIDSPPILVRGEIDPSSLTYGYSDLNAEGPLQWELAPSGAVGSEVEIILGLNRSAMAGEVGDFFAGILQLTDSFSYTQVEIPVSGVVASSGGLWVGEAEIDQVRNDITFFERNDDGTVFDEDGNPTVLATSEDYAGVPRPYTQRLIIHVDAANEMRLLQRVYYGVDKDDGFSRILATVQGALDTDQLGVARRISSVHLPWSSQNDGWAFSGDFGRHDVDLSGRDLQVQQLTSEDELPASGTNLLFLGNLAVVDDTSGETVSETLYVREFDKAGVLVTDTVEGLSSNLNEDFGALETLVAEALIVLETGSLTTDEENALKDGAEAALSRAQIVTQVSVAYDNQATNPFLHTYHPDHDNRDAEFNTTPLDIGVESYQIVRDIGLLFSLPEDDFDSLTAGAGRLTGSYAEEITLTGKEVLESTGDTHFETKNYGVQGTFVLNRITDIDGLQTE